MNYAIIAAGEGSRLAQEGVNEPKPLVKVQNEHLIDRLIRVFMDNDAEKITIIIEAKYYHTSELQSFTQFVGNSVRSIFNVPGAVEVQINHLGVTSAVVMKPAGEAEVIAQVFN